MSNVSGDQPGQQDEERLAEVTDDPQGDLNDPEEALGYGEAME